jgi:hypothetical protein
MEFFKKLEIIHAEKFYPDSDSAPVGVCHCTACDAPHIHVVGGVIQVTGGDWIVTDDFGQTHICPDDVYAKLKQSVEIKETLKEVVVTPPLVREVYVTSVPSELSKDVASANNLLKKLLGGEGISLFGRSLEDETVKEATVLQERFQVWVSS